MQRYNFSLLENAKDSLEHGIEHFTNEHTPNYLKYAILHISQAVELFLKERLFREHPLLVFARPEHSNLDSKTVTFEDSIARLNSANVELDDEMLKAFRSIQLTRNQIQHFKVSLEKEKVVAELGRTLKYLEKFLQDEFELSIENEINPALYSVYCEAIYSYNEINDKILGKIQYFLPSGKDRLLYKIDFCPNCGYNSIVFPDPRSDDSKKVECFFCEETFAPRECDRCGSLIFEKDGIYHSCWVNHMGLD